MHTAIFLSGVALATFMIYWIRQSNKSAFKVPKQFPPSWKELLLRHVHFYQNLNEVDREKFERRINNFLKQVRITGIRTTVSELDQLLIASSAAIPLFNFPSWSYRHLHEVLLYPASFDRNFSMENPEEVITGMVGSGKNMDGVMILSQESLRKGFENTEDKKNVGIHEFVHILDKEDGVIDGIPGIMNDKALVKPWLQLMHREISQIKNGRSDIDPYAGTGEEEFLAVCSEYFFERPKMFKVRHPELYNKLQNVYGLDMITRLGSPFQKAGRIGRNRPCPCGSTEKFKNCCLKE